MNRFLKSPAMLIAVAVLCLLAVPAVCYACDATGVETLIATVTMGAILGLGDKLLTVTTALPNGAASTTSTAIDLLSTAEFLADVEFEVYVPALTVTQLADTQTITYIVETCAESGFSSPTTFITSLGVQTGAGGAGCAEMRKRFRLPTTTLRYVRIKATKAGASNASTASMIFKCLQLS